MRLLIRLGFAVLRSLLLAISVTTTGWLMIAGPNGEERRALHLSADALDTDGRAALMQMRLARAALALAPDAAIDLLVSQTRGQVSRAQIEMALRRIAAGRQATPDPDPQAPPGRGAVGGAKFLKPPTRDG